MSEISMDPRIRQRRISVRRDAARRRLRRLTMLGVSVSVLVVLFAVAHSPVLDVDRVTVDGAMQTGAEAVRRASGVDTGDATLFVDAGAVAERVEALPWVADARVHRRLPSTVTIDVTERVAAAVLVRAGRSVLVDRTGHALDTVASPPLGLVAVGGLESLPAPGERVDAPVLDAVRVAMRLADELPGEVRAVVLGEVLRLTLTDGARVVLGTLDDLDAKLVAVAAVLGQVDRHCIERLDVRAPGSPVLTRGPACG